MSGPLSGVVVVEMSGIGPCPLAGMLLADLGAEVIRVDRVEAAAAPGAGDARADVLNRGKRSVALNLKHPEGLHALQQLIDTADVLIEGYRPGVMERLGVGPEQCRERNGRLVYARMTGWGQDGPYARLPGHDINFIALSGALYAIGRREERPTPPLNLVGDYGGGTMFLLMGVLSALLHVRAGGDGQVVDCSMVDGSAVLMAQFFGEVAAGTWNVERGTNALDTASHFYEVYETADGRHVAVGAAEPAFYAELVERLGLAGEEDLPAQMDEAHWPRMKSRMAAIFATKDQAEWCKVFDGAPACFAPVLPLTEAPANEHNAARGTFVEVAGVVQPAPAPRFSGTPCEVRSAPVRPGHDTYEALTAAGLSAAHVERLVAIGAAGVPS